MMILLSCSDHAGKRTYNSIAGDWILSDPDVTGQFFISGTTGLETIEKKGYFSIGLISYAITEEDSVEFSKSMPGTIQYISLSSTTYSTNTKLFLAKGNVKADFTEIYFSEIAILRSSPGSGTTLSAALRNIILKRR